MRDALFRERGLAGEGPLESLYLDLATVVWDLRLSTCFSRCSQLVVLCRTDKLLSFVGALLRDVWRSERVLGRH